MICQVNYNPSSATLFAYLASNMLNTDLVAGPPVYDPSTGIITQLYGMCPMTSGSVCSFVPLGPDSWEVSYDNGEESATFITSEVHRFFTGDF